MYCLFKMIINSYLLELYVCECDIIFYGCECEILIINHIC